MSQPPFNRRRARARRVELGLSPADLARRTGISVWSIYKYERDHNPVRPPEERLKRIADALGMEIADLLGGETGEQTDTVAGGAR